jgi:hypothetical protein
MHWNFMRVLVPLLDRNQRQEHSKDKRNFICREVKDLTERGSQIPVVPSTPPVRLDVRFYSFLLLLPVGGVRFSMEILVQTGDSWEGDRGFPSLANNHLWRTHELLAVHPSLEAEITLDSSNSFTFR